MNPESRPYIEFRQERDVSDIINATFAFLRDEFRGIATALLVIVGPLAVLSAVLGAGAQQAAFGALFNPELLLEEDVEGMFGAAYAVSVLASLVASLVALGVCYSYAMLYAEGGPGPFPPGEVWRRLVRDLWTLISTALWGFLLLVGLVLLNIVPCLGTLAFIALGAYLAPILMMVYPARLDRRRGFWPMLKRCRELVKGSWWSAFGLFVVMYVLVLIISMAMSGTMVLGFAMISNLVGGSWLAEAFAVPLALLTIISYLTYMLMAVAFVIQYFSLDEQREGILLESRVESMLAAPQAEGDPGRPFGT